MDERQFYIERQDTKNLTLVCPHCQQEGSYPIRWMVRSKKKELPRGAGEEDRKRFAKRVPTWSASMSWWPAGICAAANVSS